MVNPPNRARCTNDRVTEGSGRPTAVGDANEKEPVPRYVSLFEMFVRPARMRGAYTPAAGRQRRLAAESDEPGSSQRLSNLRFDGRVIVIAGAGGAPGRHTKGTFNVIRAAWPYMIAENYSRPRQSG
jgi:hypothetical protein